MISREELRSALHEAGLGRIADAMAALAEPCVLIRTHALPYLEDIATGQSRIGGLPDLPPEITWPVWHGRPLSFLAQLELSDLNAFACFRLLPSTGYLWFFYDAEQRTWGFDPKDGGSWAVVYSPCNRSDLRSRVAPESDFHCYQWTTLTFHDFFSMPGPENLSVAPLEVTLEELELLEEIDADLHEMIASGSNPYEPHHQLLGHPKEIQGEMQRECQLASNGIYCGGAAPVDESRLRVLESGAQDWRLLFQLDTDDDSGKPGMMWGDCGRLYFWIRNQDLANRAFDKSWMVLQCS